MLKLKKLLMCKRSRHRYRGGISGLVKLTLAALFLGCSISVYAQNGEQNNSVGEDAVDAVTQPFSDFNLRNRDIPLILLRVQSAPYEMEGDVNCDTLSREIADLDSVLGPDADSPPDKDGIINKGLNLGGHVIGGFIPFRGLVRQLSGANAERRRWEAALYGGIARRSYLKGYAKASRCLSPEEASIQSAEQILGLDQMDQNESND